MIAMDSRLERQARNEALIREVNERIERVAEEARLGGEPERFEFLCECGAGGDGDIACAGRIEMTVAEYEEIRGQDDRFALLPGHESEELEDVIRRTDRFVVVDKNPAAEPFVDDDPRGAPLLSACPIPSDNRRLPATFLAPSSLGCSGGSPRCGEERHLR